MSLCGDGTAHRNCHSAMPFKPEMRRRSSRAYFESCRVAQREQSIYQRHLPVGQSLITIGPMLSRMTFLRRSELHLPLTNATMHSSLWRDIDKKKPLSDWKEAFKCLV